MIKMLRVDIGHDGDVGRQLEKGAIAFVGLDNHPVTGPQTRIRAIGVDDAAVDHRRIKAPGLQQSRDERGRCRLAVRAGDGDTLLEAHQLRQHLGAAHDRQPFFAGEFEFGIVALDGGRNDDDFRVAEVFRFVPDVDERAFFAQAQDIGVLGGVGALHGVAEIEQHLGDAGHADAANADEMNRA